MKFCTDHSFHAAALKAKFQKDHDFISSESIQGYYPGPTHLLDNVSLGFLNKSTDSFILAKTP